MLSSAEANIKLQLNASKRSLLIDGAAMETFSARILICDASVDISPEIYHKISWQPIPG